MPKSQRKFPHLNALEIFVAVVVAVVAARLIFYSTKFFTEETFFACKDEMTCTGGFCTKTQCVPGKLTRYEAWKQSRLPLQNILKELL